MSKVFYPFEALLPKRELDYQKWAVIACDQFTSQPDYWDEVKNTVGDSYSTLNLILPEIELSNDISEKVDHISASMRLYLDRSVFVEYRESYIYVERTLQNGAIRRGIVGCVDLEQYDYELNNKNIRATEQTVIERIPPRVSIREKAILELPHVILFSNDRDDIIMKDLTSHKDELEGLYDFELMNGGGHITGWLIKGDYKAQLEKRLTDYTEHCKTQYGENAVVFVVGDGNHSLATAKACYEKLKKDNPSIDLKQHPARYAMVELDNIFDESHVFEPIHRVLTDINPVDIMCKLQKNICGQTGYPVKWYSGLSSGTVYVNVENGDSALATMQEFFDNYLKENGGKIDYIHGEDVVVGLSKDINSIGFVFLNFDKKELFSVIEKNGVLPRKSFSIGHAKEKRYYIEARKIK